MVIGAGKSGVACANLLAGRGFGVLLSDAKPPAQLKERLKKLDERVELEAGGHTDKTLRCGFAVKSPGLPHSAPLMLKLKKKRIPVFSEIEAALAFADTEELLAVTGTNGKTTTTVLLGEIMKQALRGRGGTARICGNVGTPASEIAGKTGARDAIVMEVSSYQLEDSSFLRPRAAGVLNVTPDHLDRHRTMARYVKAKTRIFSSQTRADACIFNADDRYCRRIAAACPSRKFFFSSFGTGGRLDAWLERPAGSKKSGTMIVLKHGGKTVRLVPPDLPGVHNLENAMCAALMALSRGVRPGDIQKVFSSFKGVEHRIEPVRRARGMVFINDSKATNVDSTLVALKAVGGERKNIWLILGGLDKGSPYAPLAPWLKRSVKAVLAIGAAAPKITRELRTAARVINAGTISGALAGALAGGERGDIVLLSPACASFDQFRDFEDRGRQFKKLVREIKCRRP